MTNNAGIMPIYSQLYQPPPYHYHLYERLSAFCIGNPDGIRAFIPSPLEYISDHFTAFIMVVKKIDGLRPYEEGGIQIPVQYKNQRGIITAWEYTTTDDALCAGREIWGYPKKLIERGYIDRGKEKVSGAIERLGHRIIQINLFPEEKSFEPEWDVVSEKRFQVKSIPSADGGIDINKVIEVNLEDTGVTQRVIGRGEAFFEPSDQDPLYRLGPVEVLGANYLVGSFILGRGIEVS